MDLKIWANSHHVGGLLGYQAEVPRTGVVLAMVTGMISGDHQGDHPGDK